MKKIRYAAIAVCGIVLLACCGFFAYQCWNLNDRYQTLETETFALREDNSKLQEDNSKLDEELTDHAAQLKERESYVAGQKEYISELSGQLESLTESSGNDGDSQSTDGSSGNDGDSQSTDGSSGNDGDSQSTDGDSGSDTYPNLYADGCSPQDNEKVVYLTFDDGPSNLTPKVLDLLDSYHAKATFFVVCKNNEEYVEYLSEIVSRGHTLALHSYSHNYNEIYASKDAFLRDYEKVYDWVVENTGYTPSLFRFPGGSNNGSSYVVNSIIDEMEERGFQYFDWNVSSGDGSELTTTENIIDNVCNNVGTPEHPVVLMHDGRGKNATLAALPTVLEYLSDNGYEFRSLDKNVEAVHYR